MLHDAGMKPSKRKEFSSPEIETDLSRIQSLSRKHDEENWEFRWWLRPGPRTGTAVWIHHHPRTYPITPP